MIKALGMRARWLKHEWLWKVRWAYLMLVALVFCVGAIILGFRGYNQQSFYIGVVVGFLGTAGFSLVWSLIDYAIKRIKLGRKVKRFYTERAH